MSMTPKQEYEEPDHEIEQKTAEINSDEQERNLLIGMTIKVMEGKNTLPTTKKFLFCNIELKRSNC
jgi:hypothetical protein